MANTTNLKNWLVISVVLVVFWTAVASGGVIYVDANAPPGGDGQTWATAYKYLQDALAEAQWGDQVWVAEGTYKPDEDEGGNVTPGERTETFQLINGLAIYGGYAGVNEPDPNARDIGAYETILSGDIGTEVVNGDNSYHVVTGSGTDANALLDGFTLTAGNANDLDLLHWCGGGMYNWESSPTLTNCTFSGNWAWGGGGMGNDGYSTPTVTNCTFSGNWAYGGGGMGNWSNSSPTVTNCTFSGNSATIFGGGGMHNDSSSPMVTNCRFSGNTRDGMHNFRYSNPTVVNCTFSSSSGRGMINIDSSPTVTNCTFSGNSAGIGGGMYNFESSPRVTNCTFSGNRAVSYGGGIRCVGGSPTIENCIFSDNSAEDGGGMENESSSAVVTGCIFTGNNSTYGSGGGMCNYDCAGLKITNCIFAGNSAYWGGGITDSNSSPAVINCTFSGNSGTYGGGIANYGGSNPNIANCIFWANTAPTGPQIDNSGGGSATVRYSDIEGAGQAWGISMLTHALATPVMVIIIYSRRQADGTRIPKVGLQMLTQVVALMRAIRGCRWAMSQVTLIIFA